VQFDLARNLSKFQGLDTMDSTFDEILKSTLCSLVEFMPREIATMPLSRWSESVLRYFFCRFLAAASPEVTQFVECDKIDLVLRLGESKAFVEFKFYTRPQRFDAYDGRLCGFKGGPGPKNLAEFQSCVDKLHARRNVPGLSKYIVLVYSDSVANKQSRNQYSYHYDEYTHPIASVPFRVLEFKDVMDIASESVRARLYKIDG
jgi:hypothetical protein